MNENLKYFDEEDDIILPVSVWGELYYVWCIIVNMIQTKSFSKSEFLKLERQFNIWKMSRGKL